MADPTPYTTTIEVPTDGHAEAKPGVIDVSGSMMVLTYVTFAITAVVLYKVAWKPILAALDKREQALKQSLEDAENHRVLMANIEKTRAAMIDEADEKARNLIEQARRGAAETARSIENKARSESQILIENAKREIHAEQDRAMAALRKESADMALEIARKILREELDADRAKKLNDTVIERM
jgi:F-type H+-transporting ATPase subunit b